MDESITGTIEPRQRRVLGQDALNVQPRDNRFSLLLAATGFGLFWATMLVILVGSAFAPPDNLFTEGLVDRFLLLFGMTVVCLASHSRRFDRVFSHGRHNALRYGVAVVAVVFIAVVIIGATPGLLPHIVYRISWLIFGISSGLFAVLWGVAWSLVDAERSDNHTSALAIAGSCVLVSLFATFMLFSPAIVSIAVVGVMVLVSLVLQLIVFRQFPVPQLVDRKTSQQRLKLFSLNMLSPGVLGCSLGYVLALMTLDFGWEGSLPLCLGGVAVGGLTSVAVLGLLGRVSKFSSVERVVFTVLGAGMLALPFVEDAVRAAILAVLTADLICYFAFHWNVLVALSYRHHVQLAFHYSQGLIAPLAGVALGWGFVAASAFFVGWGAESVLIVGTPIVAFLLVLSLAVVPYASNKTVETVFVEEDAEEPRVAVRSWRFRCEEVCKTYALTPREQEVFLLLAKGRNAEHIGKLLFISTHTAKTHTSRIYRKLTINSQQELIDLIESV